MRSRLNGSGRTLALMSGLALVWVVVSAASPAPGAGGAAQPMRSGSPPKPHIDANRVMTKPTGYRKWVFIGTPITPNELNPPEAPFPDFHNVYIHPADFAHYERTGEFPEGTVIIKELVAIGSKKATSGNGYFQGEFIGLEAAVKDSRRFADQPGHWAYYTFGHSYPLQETTAPQSKEACNACHGANADQDYVFTQYYPVLRGARQGR